MASYRTDREDSTKRYWQDHDEVKASVKKIGKRFGRLIPDFLSNIVANPLRNAAKMTWQLLAIPAKLMWNGRLDNHPRYAGEKSMKNSVKGLGMLIVTTLLLPLEFSVAFLAAEFMNLGNTVKDPFKMVFTGTVGEQFEYDF